MNCKNITNENLSFAKLLFYFNKRHENSENLHVLQADFEKFERKIFLKEINKSKY